MATGVNFTRGSLVIIWGFAVYSTWYLFLNNGTVEQVNKALAGKPPLLPGTQELLKTSYTGLKPIDDQLALLAVVFHQTLDGSLPHATLWGFMFLGQFAAAYVLLLVESSRRGNRGKFIAYTVVWGLLCQNAIAACTIPIFLLVHLSTSPTASPKPTAADVAVNIPTVSTASISLILGFFLPIFTSALPAPSIISFDQKQNYMAIWQIFPITVGILQYILPAIRSALVNPPPKSGSSYSASLNSLRPAYVAAFIFAAIPRITMITLIAANTWFPDVWAPEYRGALSISSVMVAAGSTPSFRPTSIGAGNLLLLHYDEICCAISWIFWAVTIYLQTDKSGKGVSRWATLIARGVGAWAVAGPLGTAIVCLWGRDELILGEREIGAKKVQ